MGVLNALIVEEEDRPRIESLDQGTCDTYIYGSVEHVKNNMLELLNIDNEENDIFILSKDLKMYFLLSDISVQMRKKHLLGSVKMVILKIGILERDDHRKLSGKIYRSAGCFL